MSSSINKPALITATLAGSIALAGSAFAATPLAQGYMLGAQDAAPEQAQDAMSHGHMDTQGMGPADTDGDGRVSADEFASSHPDDSGTFASLDANADGFIDAPEMKAHKTEGGVSAKADMEGKCGEGRCGGSI